MKIWESEHTFQHPWETVVQATWRKYPNPMNPNVKGLDVVERKVDSKGILHSHRLMATEWGMPQWLTKFIGLTELCYVSEHSAVNAHNKQMVLRSRNLTLCNFITIDEQLVYKQHPQNPKNTLLRQEAVINIKGVPMTDYLEGVVFGNCSSNAHKGRDAMEWVISHIKDEAKDLARSANEKMESMKKFTTSNSTSL